MNSKPNVFLSSMRQPPKSNHANEKKEFLNTVNDLTRDMYQHNREDIPVTENRFEGDKLLHQSDRMKHQARDKDRLIRDLSEQVKTLKDKMSFVIEKDQEIYKLQCENTHLKDEVSEYQATTVTDETLLRDNESLRNELQIHKDKYTELETRCIEIQKKLITLYRENQELQKRPSTVTDEMIGKYIRNLVSKKNIDGIYTL
jgi:hypothetical protein